MMVQFNIAEVSNGFVVTVRKFNEGSNETTFVWKRVFIDFEGMVSAMREAYVNAKIEEKTTWRTEEKQS